MFDQRSSQLQMVLAVMKAQRGPQTLGQGTPSPSRTLRPAAAQQVRSARGSV